MSKYASIGFLRSTLTWIIVLSVILVPVLIAAMSPLQSGRDAIYIMGEMGGIICLALLFVQPLLVAGFLPGLSLSHQRRWHRTIGAAILFALALHIGGLYLTSPADMTDALLLASPTPFSVYGVVGLWALVLAAIVAFTRPRSKLSHNNWRMLHSGLAVVVVVASVVHALMIEGVMGTSSKIALCVFALVATAVAIWKLKLLKSSVKTGWHGH